VGDDSEARVLDGRAWREFCETLARAGDVVLRDGSPHDAFDRAEGFRYLSRLARGALETFVELADPDFPVFRRPAHETLKIGADNPDNHYQSATVSGAHEYVIRGRRNTVHYLGIGTYHGNYGSSARRGQSGYLDRFETGPDGRFEVALSRERRPGNWLPMEPDTDLVIVRQTFQDRSSERIADLSIERVGGPERPAPLTPAFLDRWLRSAAAWVQGTASLFADWAEGFAQRTNELPRFDPAVATAAHGDPNIVYYHGYWELGPDEAYVMDVTPPDCEYWNFQVNNHWMESLDYRYHRIALNHHEAARREDGSVRLVLAHEDPGVPNWLETAGHRRGTCCLRWVGAREHPDPAVRIVPFTEVRHLG
jgi:hypothetical protein